MKTVAVTGATGFIGQHTCRGLAARGWKVRALVRRDGITDIPGVTSVVIPDWNAGSVGAALAGASAVVHLAGRAHMLLEQSDAGLDRFRSVNVELTRTLLQAADGAAVRRFLFLSSIGAVCSASDSVVHDGTLAVPTSAYGLSKLEAERLVLSVVNGRMTTAVLRPPMVYGEGMRGNPLRLFDLVARGLPLPVGSIRNARTLLYVGNLIAAIAATLQSEVTGRAFAVSDSESLSTPELIRMIAVSLGLQPRILPVPVPVLRAVGRAGDLLRHVMPVPVTSAEIERLVSSLVVDSSGLSAATGYRPPFTTGSGLDRTGRWYRERTT